MNSSEIRAKAREILSGNWKHAILLALVYLVVDLIFNLISYSIPFSPLANRILSLLIAIISYPISYGILSTFMKFKNGEEVTYFSFLTDGYSNFVKLYKIVFSTVARLILPIVLTFIGFVFVFTSLFTALGALSNNENIESLVYEISTAEDASVISSLTAELDGISNQIINDLPSYITILLLLGLVIITISSIWLTIRSLYYVLTSMIFFENHDMKSRDIVRKSRELMNKQRWKYFVLNLSFIGWYFVIAIVSTIITQFIGDVSTYINPLLSACLFPYVILANIVFYQNLKQNATENSQNNVEQ